MIQRAHTVSLWNRQATKELNTEENEALNKSKISQTNVGIKTILFLK